MHIDMCYGGVPSKAPENSMGIRGYDFVEFYVGSAKMTLPVSVGNDGGGRAAWKVVGLSEATSQSGRGAEDSKNFVCHLQALDRFRFAKGRHGGR